MVLVTLLPAFGGTIRLPLPSIMISLADPELEPEFPPVLEPPLFEPPVLEPPVPSPLIVGFCGK